MSQPVRFTHNTRNPRLRYTVAYSFAKGPDGIIDVTYGIAQCRKNDTFNRAAGRELAAGRLNKALKGKSAPLSTPDGYAQVPLYGKLAVQDHDGLSVGKFVAETFETDRTKVMSANAGADGLAAQMFGPEVAKLLGFK